ncbi:MAG: hypothetical protein OEL81_08545 [Nitrosopumilus sp.]|nr:hypothetical protein [Nitrosopumilus sp.]
MIEAGCMNIGFALDCAIDKNISYYGVDPVSDLIQDFTNRLTLLNKSKKIHIKLLCGDIVQIKSLIKEDLKQISKGIVIFPFNSFGNLSSPEDALFEISKCGLDVAIFTYNTDLSSTQIRYKYYKNCSFNNLIQTQDVKGILFSSDEGLHSYSYNKKFLTELLEQNGFDVQVRHFAQLGILYIGHVDKRVHNE